MNYSFKFLVVGFVLSLFSISGGRIPMAHANDLSKEGAQESWWSPEELEKKLGDSGVEGEVHAIHAETETYVFTLRNPNNFFEFVHFSLVPWTPRVGRQLAALNRHDRVRIFGEVMKKNRSPQIHIELTKIEVVQKYQPEICAPTSFCP